MCYYIFSDLCRSLEDKVKVLATKLSTAELQIEKDWMIIERQSNQIENLHVQFIEQRDENRQQMMTLAEKEQEFQQLNDRMFEIQRTSKGKEEELERILEEKEDGIEKLHSMIFELEKSLSNSQIHIEGTLFSRKSTL